MASAQQRRIYRLVPWLIRALIPRGWAGNYRLYRAGRLVYTGRSDRDLAARLCAHAYAERAHYFDYDACRIAQSAYDLECAYFHLGGDSMENQNHPATPVGSRTCCAFCLGPVPKTSTKDTSTAKTEPRRTRRTDYPATTKCVAQTSDGALS